MLSPIYMFKNKSLNLLKYRGLGGPPCRCPCLYCQSLASGCKNPAANLLMSLFWQDCIAHCLLMQCCWLDHATLSGTVKVIQETVSKPSCKHNLEPDSPDSQSSSNNQDRTAIFPCTVILFSSKLWESSVFWDKFILRMTQMKWVKSHQGFIWLITIILSPTSMLCIAQLTHSGVWWRQKGSVQLSGSSIFSVENWFFKFYF